MRSHIIHLLVAATCASAALLPGCSATSTEGYAATSPFPTIYRSVSLPIFRNETMMRGFDRDLADALVKQVEQSTPYKVRSEASEPLRRSTFCNCRRTRTPASPTK